MANERLGIFEELQERAARFSRFMRRAPGAYLEAPDPIRPKVVRKAIRHVLERQPQGIRAEMLSMEKKSGPQLRVIFEAIEEATGSPYEAMWSPGRNKSMAQPRQFAAWMIWGLRWDLSLSAIGYVFDRDHTTIMHAVRKLQDNKDEAPFFGWRNHPAMGPFMATWRARPMRKDEQ